MLLKGFLIRILRQLQSIEASVALGIRIDRIILYFLNLKQLILPSITFQIFESQNGHSTISSNEMKHILKLVVTQSLNILPKPLDDFLLRIIIGVLNIIL